MRYAIRVWLIVAVLGALTVAPAGFAQQLTTTTYGPFVITSTSGTQLSSNVFTVNVQTLGALQVEYTAAATHCSDVRIHFLVDGVERALSGFVTPGTSTGFFNVGPVSAGAHTVALQAEGRVGGCNTGVLGAWGGTTSITVSALSAANIPAPGLIATFIAFALGVLAFGPWRRR
ncbi:MAG TPA: hypothetical protein VNG69_02415 [Casimicrobiaceae bacterium]|nr:hypothetical protein [Casimicrobiaceae bacterium]